MGIFGHLFVSAAFVGRPRSCGPPGHPEMASREAAPGSDAGMLSFMQRAGAMGSLPLGSGQMGVGTYSTVGMPVGPIAGHGGPYTGFHPGGFQGMQLLGFPGLGGGPGMSMGVGMQQQGGAAPGSSTVGPPTGSMSAEAILQQAQRLEIELTNGWITPEEAHQRVRLLHCGPLTAPSDRLTLTILSRNQAQQYANALEQVNIRRQAEQTAYQTAGPVVNARSIASGGLHSQLGVDDSDSDIGCDPSHSVWRSFVRSMQWAGRPGRWTYVLLPRFWLRANFRVGVVDCVRAQGRRLFWGRGGFPRRCTAQGGAR